MTINYTVYDTSDNNTIVFCDLESWNQALMIAARNKYWVATNTKKGLRDHHWFLTSTENC